MLSCKEVSKLMSDSREEHLPLSKRMGVRMHLMMCRMCRVARKQMVFVRQLLAGYDQWLEEEDSSENRLPPAKADQIKRALAESAEKPAGDNPENKV